MRYAGFNLASTGFLFVMSLALKRLAHAQTNIPLPHYVETFLITADKWVPFPLRSTNSPSKNLMNENELPSQTSGIYTEIAHVLNRLTFAFFTLIYVLNIISTFLFA